jgi:hypothetical protein
MSSSLVTEPRLHEDLPAGRQAVLQASTAEQLWSRPISAYSLLSVPAQRAGPAREANAKAASIAEDGCATAADAGQFAGAQR